MIALKMASLARGASGVAFATLALMAEMLARDIVPLVPAQGSVGASGDLAPLAHMAAAMIGVGDVFDRGSRRAAAAAFGDAGLAPLELGRRRDWRCSTAPSFRPPMPSPASSMRNACKRSERLSITHILAFIRVLPQFVALLE